MVHLEDIDIDKLVNKLADRISRRLAEFIKEDDQGRIWFRDEDGKWIELFPDEKDSKKAKSDKDVIKEASQMSLQKKEQRLMVNLPEWLKDRLQKRAKQTGKSMNEIIRLALTQYLAK